MTLDSNLDGPQLAEQTLFSALLTPHRSLNRTRFMVLMAVLTLISFAAGMMFLMMGAWPVFGFFGLDVLAVYWAFRINFRRALATEEISITHLELRVRRTTHRGHIVEWVSNPLWVHLDQIVHEDYGIERLYLVSRGRRISIANFLGPDEKSSFVKAFSNALQIAKRGPIYNPIT
ncbi:MULTISPECIES: DUF2244 domain-containing protein [unclassified Nitrobacter]|uniref:DUF2244 domain-containing protein n=1 Tax=unclassified Nitrobacter TaxID=2620411 RepID=UPI000926F46C|nr:MULTISPECIES: DUF2244 domain-containing protein [unclassified Nitrobacter]MBN9148451.1 DUF2244 domain-containing protein [Nitrobacter sp.]OJV00146.1 MAG: hypothetical protein BGO16_06260 [Nitrobacter sp. 62-23]